MSKDKTDVKGLISGLKGREELLVQFLGTLNEEMAEKLAIALEHDRALGGNGLPFESILAGLRPKLRARLAATRRRIATPQRIFAEPFEGLIVDETALDKRPGRIGRSSIDPVWRWLIEVDRAASDPIIERVRTTMIAGGGKPSPDAVGALDEFATQTMRAGLKEAEESPKAAKRLIECLGSERTLEDMREMARVLAIAKTIRQLHSTLPAEIDQLRDADKDAIRTAFEDMTETAPQAAGYLLLSLARRFVRPWELFGLAGRLSGADDDQDLKDSDVALVGERFVTDLEVAAAQFKAMRPADFDPDAATRALNAFAQLQAGMTRQVGMRKDGIWGKRLLKCRGAISDALEGLFDRIAKDIQAALPMAKSPGKSASRSPRLDKAPEEPVMERCAKLAAFLGQARRHASQLGFAVAHEKAQSELTNYFDEYGSALVSDIVKGRRKERETAAQFGDGLLRIMKPMCTDEAFAVMSRRIAAANTEAAKQRD